MLLTWQGPWGVVLSPEVPSTADVATVTQFCLQSKQWQETWNSFLDLVQMVSRDWFCSVWAATFELCTKSWAEKGELRVHAHAYLKKDSKLRSGQHAELRFRDTFPHRSNSLAGLCRHISGWAVAYYCWAPKQGTIFVAGSHRPFREFPVNPEWIFSILQSEKLNYTDAKEQLVLCGKGLVRRLADLDRWRAAREEMAMTERMRMVQMEIAKSNKEFCTYPAIENWKEKNTKQYLRRKQFLVLEGASGLGKTEFARAMFGPENTLELNCAGIQHVNLRLFEPGKHKCIFWDEASVNLVLAHRKLFQCPACMVDLAHSPTGRDVYAVWVNDAVMVLGSNRWSLELESLACQADREWMEANQVLVLVKSPMYKR